MHQQIPNVSVATTADSYQEAAELIHSNSMSNGRLGRAACINAALSIEIYLKSFLAEVVLTPTGTGMNLVTQKTKKGHDLVQLYQQIPQEIRNRILSASHTLNEEIDFEKSLDKYKDYFFLARYSYEMESQRLLNTEIVFFASHMRKLVRVVAKMTSS